MTAELASYLDVLGSSIRLKILKIIEKKPLDVESLSHELMQFKINSSRKKREETAEHWTIKKTTWRKKCQGCNELCIG
jgi:hypothetical protein